MALFFTVFFGCLYGCQSNVQSDLDKLFAQKPEIKLPIQLSNIESDDIGMPIYFACTDSLLVVSEMFQSHFITVYNTNNGQIINRFASKGNGPNELLGVSGIYFSNNHLLIHSPMPHRMLYVQNSDLLASPTSFQKITAFKEDDASYLKMAPVSDGLFMGTAMLNQADKGGQFALANTDGKFLRAVDQYPLNKELKSVPNHDLAFGFQGALSPSADGRYALYSGPLHGVLKFFRFDKDNPKKIKEYVFAFPQFTSRADPQNQTYGVQVSQESIAGTISVAVSDDSYYILFSNKQPREFNSNIIYVFDFHGNPTKKILLDEPVRAIVYSQKDHSLWAYRELADALRIDIIKLP